MVVDYSRDVLEHMTISLGGNVNIDNIGYNFLTEHCTPFWAGELQGHQELK